jgi:hypothetical protein
MNRLHGVLSDKPELFLTLLKDLKSYVIQSSFHAFNVRSLSPE